MVDQSRRDLIKSVTKGAIYATPVISTIAAPRRLMAQGSSMLMFCDYFPILCMVFGQSAAAPGAGYQSPGVETAPWTSPAPWDGGGPGSNMPN